MRENCVWEEDYNTIPKKHRQENSQGWNWKMKRIIITYLKKKNYGYNELIYAGTKIVCEKIGVKKKHEQKLKTWMGNSP